MGLNIALAQENIMTAFVNMPNFPFKTGQLKEHIYDGSLAFMGNNIETNLLENDLVKYGFILNNSPRIRYNVRPTRAADKLDSRRTIKGVSKKSYSFIEHPNKHYRFMDNFFENDAIGIIERTLGVRRVS